MGPRDCNSVESASAVILCFLMTNRKSDGSCGHDELAFKAGQDVHLPMYCVTNRVQITHV